MSKQKSNPPPQSGWHALGRGIGDAASKWQDVAVFIVLCVTLVAMVKFAASELYVNVFYAIIVAWIILRLSLLLGPKLLKERANKAIYQREMAKIREAADRRKAPSQPPTTGDKPNSKNRR